MDACLDGKLATWPGFLLSAAKQGLTRRAGGQVRIEGRPITSVLGAKSRFWAADGSAVGVEELALQFYATPEAGGWKGARYPDLYPFTQCCVVGNESGRCSTCQHQRQALTRTNKAV